jgi:hypothetical protein
MTNRTIYVIGQGYSPTPVSIVATLDGNVVYSGTIPTINEDISVTKVPNPDRRTLQEQLEMSNTALFSISEPVEYAGTGTLNIEVSGGTVWFGSVMSNYLADPHLNPVLTPEQQVIATDPNSTVAQIQQLAIDIANPPFSAEEIAQIQAVTTFPYPPDVLTIINAHNAKINWASSGPDGFGRLPDLTGSLDDTWSNVSINGVAQPINPDAYTPPLTGTWWWTLFSGDVFSATIRIVAGVPTP